MSSKMPVMEIFGPTIQGEGLMGGTISHFIRMGGCGYRCTWCDTMFAVDPEQVKVNAEYMTAEEIFIRVSELPFAPWVTLSGGDPCIHEGLGFVVQQLNARGIRVAVETQGQTFPSWLREVDTITFSPKPPSAGYSLDKIPKLLTYLMSIRNTFTGRICIKIPIFDRIDLEFALEVYKMIPHQLYDAFYFTAGTNQKVKGTDQIVGIVLTDYRALTKAVLMQASSGHIQFNDKTFVGCQQHVLLWPQYDRGV